MKKNSYRPKTIAILHIYELENSSYADRTSVIYIRELDTARRCTCMNDRAATDINSNVTTVAYNISRLCIRKTYLVSNTLNALEECGSPTPNAAYTLITKPEQSAPFVRLVPPYT